MCAHRWAIAVSMSVLFVVCDGGGGGATLLVDDGISNVRAEGAGGLRGGFPFGNNLTQNEAVRIAVTMPITSRGDFEGGIIVLYTRSCKRCVHVWLPVFGCVCLCVLSFLCLSVWMMNICMHL